MKYTALGKKSRHFELFNEMGDSLACLDYKGWFSVKVSITIGNDVYYIKPANFWQSTFNVIKGEEIIATLKFNGLGNFIVGYNNNTYLFKASGFWQSKYKLFTEHKKDIITLNPDYKLPKFSFDYQIDTDDNYDEGKNALLLLLLVYCCNYIYARISGMATVQ